jgi:hypothetical protein
MYSLSSKITSVIPGFWPTLGRATSFIGWRYLLALGPAALMGIACQAAGPVSDFHLIDCNAASPRYRASVSPRDYQLRISAYYFATAGCTFCRDQFRHLCTLARELQACDPPLSIEILAVNQAGQSTYNFLIPSQGTLPWLQDMSTESVWTKWGAALRDLWILDSLNRVVAVTNLTSPNLALESNRAALKQILLSHAQVTDSDADRLPDDWEQHYFQSLRQAGPDDPDADGANNFAEYSLGTDPTRAEANHGVTWRMGMADSIPTLFATFHRRAGSALKYRLAVSPDLRSWNDDSTVTPVPIALRQLYDGSGTAEVTVPLAHPSAPFNASFLRIEALPGAMP